MGKDWDEIPDGMNIETWIEENQWNFLDLNIIQDAHKKIESQ